MSSQMISALVPHCGLRPDSPLGGEVFERQLLERLPDHGVFPIVGLPRSRRIDDLPEGWRVHELRPGRGLRWYLAPTAFFPFAVGQLRTGSVDLLRAHSPRFVAPSLLAARRATSAPWAPLVVHHHHREPGPASSVDLWALRRADLVVVPTEAVKRDLVVHRVAAESVAVVANGVELAKPAGGALSWRVEPGHRLLFVGRFIPRKRPLVALELAAREPAVELIMVGDGPLLADARRRAQSRDLAGRVQFHERVSEAEKAWLMTTADLLVVPSELEGFSLVALEAQRAGTAVIAGPAEAVREVVVNGVTGAHVAEAHAAAFVQRGRLLLESRERLRSMGRAGAQHAEAFSWDATAASTAALYRRLVAQSRSVRVKARTVRA
jgi:glycosyltransferase involved in cell wall biosynthesis